MSEKTPAVQAIAPLTNVSATVEAVQNILDRIHGEPGLACLYGPSGYGKSYAAAFIATRYRGYWVQMRSLWSRKTLLLNILKSMGIVAAKTQDEMLDQVAEQLAITQRPLIIDEADYLVDRPKWALLLMDLFEASQAPILFLGEERMRAKLNVPDLRKVHNRVLHWIRARPADLDDCRKLAGLYARDLPVADDLLAHIANAVEGCTRRVVVNLNLVKSRAGVHGWDRVDLAAWNGQPAVERHLYTGEPGGAA